MRNNKKKKKIVGIIVFIAVLLVVIGVIVSQSLKNDEQTFEEENVPSQADNNTVYYNGDSYVYNQNIVNILFMGIDNDTEIVMQDVPGKGGQADCIMILSINKEDGIAHIMQISRNAMTDVDIYDLNGNYYASMEAQLATQYAYGNGADTSCWAMKKTVGELLYELPISGYFAMDIAAVSVVNDLLGGVTITIPEDYTEIDPAFVKGATITLSGEQAEKYVRYRDLNAIGSNDLRMQRQVQYIPALLETFRNKVGDSQEALENFYSSISTYAVTDLSVDMMGEMLQQEWKVGEAVYVPGETVAGEIYEEFYINDAELRKILIETFYKLK